MLLLLFKCLYEMSALYIPHACIRYDGIRITFTLYILRIVESIISLFMYLLLILVPRFCSFLKLMTKTTFESIHTAVHPVSFNETESLKKNFL